jgi:hypothetical protein
VTRTELVEPKLTVGKSCAPLGLDVIVALRDTVPVYPPEGVMEIMEVFPVAPPGETVTAVPVMVKLGGERSIVY